MVSKINRWTAFLFWLACTVILPVLWLMQLLQALFGSVARSHRMALAIDMCANALLGGRYPETISHRVGVHLLAGAAWAKPVAAFIDFFFGENHCREAAMTRER